MMTTKPTNFLPMNSEDSTVQRTAIVKFSPENICAFLLYQILVLMKKIYIRRHSHKNKAPKEFNYTLY